MGKAYSDYLKSDHWRELKSRKLKKRCAVCGSTKNIEHHHLFYRKLYDVEASDIRVLCHRCHSLTHKLIDSGELVIDRNKSHQSVFSSIKNAIKKSLGIGWGERIFYIQ